MKLILEAQCLLMHFLRTAVEGLLDGVDRDGSSTKWTALVESGFRASAGVESWSTYTNQASSTPLMDFGRLLDLARSRLGEANDHLYLLQTDPAYFQHHIRIHAQSRLYQEMESSGWSQNWYYMLA